MKILVKRVPIYFVWTFHTLTSTLWWRRRNMLDGAEAEKQYEQLQLDQSAIKFIQLSRDSVSNGKRSCIKNYVASSINTATITAVSPPMILIFPVRVIIRAQKCRAGEVWIQSRTVQDQDQKARKPKPKSQSQKSNGPEVQCHNSSAKTSVPEVQWRSNEPVRNQWATEE